MTDTKSISFDRIAHHYDETRRLPSRQMKPIIEAFSRELGEYGSVLEIGVGTGRFALPLQRREINLLGVDISPRMMASGLKKGLTDVLLANALFLPFKDKSVEATYSIHVLHLIGDWKGALKEIARVTRVAYYTVATHWDDIHSPFSTYWKFIRRAGHRERKPGVFERDLPDIIPPEKRTLVGSFTERRKAADGIEALERRTYSGQWTLPEEAHASAMASVREEFSDQVLIMKKKVELIRWGVEDLVTG